MQTMIYIADTAPLHSEALFAALYRLLPAYRREKIDRYAVPGGKRLSLAVGTLLRTACREQGIPDADREVLFGAQGKGYFQNVSDAFFNLSHSGERAMCVLSPVEAGCDVQQNQKILWPVARRVFSEEEQRWLREEELQGRGGEAFTRLWALKESFLKATGEGFAAAPEESVLSISGEKAALSNPGKSRMFSFFEPDLQDGYRYACCLKNPLPEEEILVRQVDFASLPLL